MDSPKLHANNLIFFLQIFSETNLKFHQKYKETNEFKELAKCLELKCAGEYKAVLKFKSSSDAKESLTTPTADQPQTTMAS